MVFEVKVVTAVVCSHNNNRFTDLRKLTKATTSMIIVVVAEKVDEEMIGW